MVLNNTPVKHVEILLSSPPLSACCRPWPASGNPRRAMLYSFVVPVLHRVELMAQDVRVQTESRTKLQGCSAEEPAKRGP